MNAVRHGLRSPAVVIPGLEYQHDWDQFLRDAIAALDPVGAVEFALAERIASLLWRLRRAGRAERDAAIVAAKKRAFDRSPQNNGVLGIINYGREFFGLDDMPEPQAAPAPPEPPDVLPAPQVLLTLSRYESRLSRQLNQALHELQALQDRRQGRDAPLARIDVDGLPESD